MIAALYVATGGAYYGLPDVDPWDVERDARLYAGPWPVVAHPPCERWGRYASGGPSHHGRFTAGDDGGCFRAAVASVRRWGGVLEHPAGSLAFERHGMPIPPVGGGWVSTLFDEGWSCCVEQGHYGHAAAKATWLYAVGVRLPDLRWGKSGKGIEPTERELRLGRRSGVIERMSRRQRIVTPPEFRDLLLAMARSATQEAA